MPYILFSSPPQAKQFSENVYKTTKYTPWNFLPKNLIFEQFVLFSMNFPPLSLSASYLLLLFPVGPTNV
jgi:hypothetical protein